MASPHRLRLTTEEYSLIAEMRANRLQQSPFLAPNNAQALIESQIIAKQSDKNRVETGAVPGMDAPIEMVEGYLRDDVIVDIKSSRIGIISDAHWPFHDLRRDAEGNFYGAYLTAIEYLREQNIGTLVLNGDMMDCYNISAHERIEKNREFSWELDVTRAMIKHLREFFGDKVRIVYREGNHEERFKRYIAKQAPELKGTVDLTDLLKLREHGVEWVEDRAKIAAGKLWIDHGHEWFGGGGVNPARNYRMKATDNVILGHVHKTSTDLFKRPLDGSIIAGWSIGCLCDLNPRYAPRNHWNHGVALVELEPSGDFTVHNKLIINGAVR